MSAHLNEVRNKSKRKWTIPLTWFGGKAWLASKIHQYTPSHTTYVELFAGAAHILFAKEPSPLEVLNDLDSDLMNFYQVLRDPRQFAEFERQVNLTPYSREQFEECRDNWHTYHDPVKRVWAWFVIHRQARNGMPEFNWIYDTTQIRRGMAASTSRWLGSIEGLPETFERLRRVQIENRDFREVIKMYDREHTWFYADPPYVLETRKSGKYRWEMNNGDHLDLIDMMLDLKGMCLVSGYDSDIYEPLESMGWEREIVSVHSGSTKESRQEILWFSPNLSRALQDKRKALELISGKT